jgi:Cof subfamily protein (haloacid dehalogenase superfamily)
MPLPLPPFYPRLLAFDMDGTLLNAQHQLSPRTQAALQALRKAGIPFVMATGRHYRDAVDTFHKAPSSWGIFCNGGAVWNAADNEFSYSGIVDPPFLRECSAFARRIGCSTFASCHDGEVYGDVGFRAEAQEMQRKANIFQFLKGDMSFLESSVVTVFPYKVSFIGVHDDLRRLKDFMGQLLRDRPQSKAVRTAFGLPQLLDLQPWEISKATGLRMVSGKLGVRASDVVAVGDGMNDEEMLQWAGWGLAMSNAQEPLKAVAKGILPHHAEDGVAQFIEALLAR